MSRDNAENKIVFGEWTGNLTQFGFWDIREEVKTHRENPLNEVLG
jgi:hypothetical protein